MEITVLTTSPEPVYEQIVRQIQDRVASGELAPTNAAIEVFDWNSTTHRFYWIGGVLTAAKNQVDLSTGWLTPSQTWAGPVRGVYVSPGDVPYIGNPSNVGPLLPHASTIHFLLP